MVTAAELKAKARSLPTRADTDTAVRTVSGKYNGNGRPKLIVDMTAVIPLARIQCTIEEIAAVLGVSIMTLRNTEGFLDTYREIREIGKKSLRRKMWKKAMAGNVPLMTWLSKQYLTMHEPGTKVTLEASGEIDVQHTHTMEIDPVAFQTAMAVLVEAGALRQLPEGVVGTGTRIIDAEATVR